MNNVVNIPAQLLKVESRSDRTYKLIFNTQELGGDKASVLLAEVMNQGWLLYSPNKINEDEVPKESADAGLGNKTPSQRLRAVLFLLWKQSNTGVKFDDYYRMKMEALIDQLKEKIDDAT